MSSSRPSRTPVLTASRKYYKSTENLRTKFNHDTGQVELFSVRQIVDEVTRIR